MSFYCTGADGHHPNPGAIVEGGALCVECGGIVSLEGSLLEAAKAISGTYAEGMKQGGRMCLPALERAVALMADGSLSMAHRVIEEEIRRIKGLPF